MVVREPSARLYERLRYRSLLTKTSRTRSTAESALLIGLPPSILTISVAYGGNSAQETCWVNSGESFPEAIFVTVRSSSGIIWLIVLFSNARFTDYQLPGED